MAVLNSAFAAGPVDFRTVNFSNLFAGTVAVANATTFAVDFGAGDRSEFTGAGFTYNAFGEPSGGVITGYREFDGGALILDFSGASVSVSSLVAAVRNGDNVGGLFLFLAGGPGDDVVNGFGGDDTLVGNGGNDALNGGGGIDTAAYGAAASQFTFTKRGASWIVADKTGQFGTDVLTDMERASFTDRVFNLQLSDSITATAEANILRQSLGFDMLVANAALTRAGATASIVSSAGATTSVATLAYQFFTGKIPSAAGIDFLVSPTGPNPNNLNSPYYQSFSLENRYINFAVNLGKLGEGKDAFAAAFGSKTLAEATRDAYAKIFGSLPSAAKVSALLDPSFTLNGKVLTRADYFAVYGQDGPNGIGTKAAMVGWLLSEAVKADVGTYSKSNTAFLQDLADGAAYSVDLVGVYSKPEFAFVG